MSDVKNITAHASDPLRTAVKSYLLADTALMTLLTGGVLMADDLSRTGMTHDDAPKEADGVRIAPFAEIHWGAGPRFGPIHVRAQRQDCEIYVYQHRGYSVISQAHTRLTALLHDVNLYASDRALSHFSFIQFGPETMADNLSMAPCQFARFEVTQIRK